MVAATRRLFLTLCFVLLGHAAHAARVPTARYKQIVPSGGENMLVNGGFERDSDGDGMPDEWGNVEHWRHTTRARVGQARLADGTYALRVEFLTDGGCVVNYLLREKRRYFRPMAPVDVYHALRVKHAGHGVVYGHAIDAQYRTIGSTAKVRRAGDWRKLAAIHRYDPAQHDGIAMLRVYIRGARAGDTYLIDDCELRVVSGDEADAIRREIPAREQWRIVTEEAASSAAKVKSWNLLSDSSFESNANHCRVRDGAKWWALGGRPVAGDSFHGELAMADRAVSDPYRYRPGVPHTISLHAKGIPGNSVAVHVASTHSPALSVKKTFRLTQGWQRYRFSFLPLAHPEALKTALKITIVGKGCLFDAVQLEEGAATAYRPRPTELFALVKRHEDRSFVAYAYDGERVPVLVIGQRQGPAEIAARVIVRDLWMNAVRQVPARLRVQAGACTARQEILLDPLPRGAYRVHVEADGVRSRSVQFGVISRDLATGSEICGGSHETGMPHNRHFVKALGLTWSRHHAAYTGPYWGRRQGVPWLGPDYWTSAEKYVGAKAWNPKLRQWGSFVYPPEPWRTALDRIAGTEKPLPEGFFQNTEEYLRAAVPRFSRNVKYWECWNEPVAFTPKQYLQMLTRFSAMVKRLDPSATVVGLSSFLDQGSWERYMAPLMEMGALKHCDVVSYHGYWHDWPEDKLFGYKRLTEYLDSIRASAAAAGKPDMPIWDNEFALWGTSWYDDERTPARVRTYGVQYDYRSGAAVIVHYVTIAYAHGVRHFGPHCFDHDLATKQEGRIEYDGHAFEYDHGLKPKSIAYAVVCHKLNQAKLASERTRDGLFAYVFSKPRGSLAVVFTRHGRHTHLELPGAGLTFRNIFDGPFAGVQTRGGVSIVPLIGEPVYVESSLPAQQFTELIGRMGEIGPDPQ